MRPRIYLDMDGVMTDFVGRVLDTWPRSIPEPGPYTGRSMTETDIDAWAIEDRIGVSREVFWASIDTPLWWRTLADYPWSTALFEMLSFYGNVTYLTSPSRSPGAASGKLSWIQYRHGREFSNWIFTNHKEHVAGPGKILLDDSEKNCEAWRQAGGKAILFPQYWNEKRAVRRLMPASADMRGRDIRIFIALIEHQLKEALS